MTTKLDKVLYTAEAHTVGGRDGAGKSSDGAIDVKLSSPGSGKPGTNPEQLFAVGYAACFIGAMKAVGPKIGVKVPEDVAIDSSVSLGPTNGGAAYGIAVKLAITLQPARQRRMLVVAPFEAAAPEQLLDVVPGRGRIEPAEGQGPQQQHRRQGPQDVALQGRRRDGQGRGVSCRGNRGESHTGSGETEGGMKTKVPSVARRLP